MEQKDSGSVVVSVGTATFRVDPVGFAIYADQFLKAAQSVPKSSKSTPVPYYLFCRALELILKAFLLAKGHGLTVLGTCYRHDLEALWKAAVKEGLWEVVGSLPAEIESDRRWAHG